MLPPTLRHTKGLRPGLQSLAVTSPSRVASQVCAYSWWHKQRDWLSQSDADYERFMRRRGITTKAKRRKAILRKEKWDLTDPVDLPHWTRSASSSNKPWKGAFAETEEDAESTHHSMHSRKQRLEQLRQKFDAKFADDPYETMFGKRFEPFWNRLMPDFLKQEMAWQTPVANEPSASTADSSTAASSFAQSRSFRMRSTAKSGSKPAITAQSSSWDSVSNKTRRSFYDPITGRMVDEPEENAPESLINAQSVPLPKSHPEDASPDSENLEALTASDIRASMGKPPVARSVAETLATRTQQMEGLEESINNKTFDSEHEELLEARKTLQTLRDQVQILERKAHADTLTKPEDVIDAERPAFFEEGWNELPQGMQTAFEAEKECDGTEKQSTLEKEMAVLNSPPAQEINDGYEPLPTGMQTQYDLENSGDGSIKTLEQELQELAKNAPVVNNDGYSTAPSGMQTLYEKEEEGVLEQELGDKLKREEHDDGYSKAPVGMQTAFDKEEVGTLEQELNAKLERKELDDGYSTAQTGMQGMYEKEGEGILEQELNEKLEPQMPEDGYSTAQTGMQGMYEQEGEGILEKELSEKLKRKEVKDGYSTAPIGMQTLYKHEDAGVLERELTEDLVKPAHDDGYSTRPSGMQTAYGKEDADALERELNAEPQTIETNDGYSTNPIGLQTAFTTEEQAIAQGSRDTLEKEMAGRSTKSEYDSGYATAPIGLQVLFGQEQIEAKKNERKSLEEELKTVRTQAAQSILDTEIQAQKDQMQDQEDGYSRDPTGMQSSFSREEKLKALQGEGDICANVGKFCNSRRWYKQTAPNNVSEQMQKAREGFGDRDLVREVTDIYENHYGAITTEHKQPSSAIETQDQVDERVQRVLSESAKTAKDTTQEAFSDSSIAPEQSAAASSSTESEPSSIKWAEPAIYKVVAYDVDKEAISITTTPSNFSNSDAPISISGALSRLHQPARFIPHFAELQKEGYQVINASRDWLVLRKVDRPSDKESQPSTENYVNPVDPEVTSRRIPYEELPTGRFASPTGFVNDDPIFTPEPKITTPQGQTITVEIPVRAGYPDMERYRHRRPRREEPVFSGQQRWRERRREVPEQRKEKRRLRDRITWALSVGAGTAVCMYVAGVIGELARV